MRYPTKSKDEKSVYGLVFFKMGGEIHYFMRYFTAAISDDRKQFSNIICDGVKFCYKGWTSMYSEYIDGE